MRFVNSLAFGFVLVSTLPAQDENLGGCQIPLGQPHKSIVSPLDSTARYRYVQ